ncbi:MAG: serine acetyltransferase [Lentisphaerae bacterium]|nr:serine acetyltransferase [Lentisphaerota bacterium]
MEKCMKAVEKNRAVDFITKLSEQLAESYANGQGVNHNEGSNLPREAEILDILEKLMELIFPGFGKREAHSLATLRFSAAETAAAVYTQLSDAIQRAYSFTCKLSQSCGTCSCGDHAIQSTEKLLSEIPHLREILMKDVQAAFDGDPAAKSLDEIILSYPCIKAIMIQRIAHILYCDGIPLIPRIMGEYAHRITAIDIHPGAKLGEGIFIDHGTGVVIGETATIGSNVKIYQGVTLGALSFPKDTDGKIIKGQKRHPTIENNVTIYAGATILGDIVIGRDSVIGGNVWLTDSVAPGTKITIAAPEQIIR